MNTPEQTLERRRHEGRTMSAEVRIDASSEDVWRAWADPEWIARWFTDRASGEARTGGVMTWEFDGFGGFPYPVVEATSPERLVFGGPLPGRPPFLLEITITREAGSTVLRLVNSGFLEGGQWDEEYAGVLSGWQMSLAVLKYHLERYTGSSKRKFMVVRPAPFSYDTIRDWYTDAGRLGEWLTRSGAPSKPGRPYELELSDGVHMRGTTLAVTDSEVSLSWDDERLVVELKAFTMGPTSRMVGIRALGWGTSAERMAELEATFGTAVERLAERLRTH